jgi:hypothetical protein
MTDNGRAQVALLVFADNEQLCIVIDSFFFFFSIVNNVSQQ